MLGASSPVEVYIVVALCVCVLFMTFYAIIGSVRAKRIESFTRVVHDRFALIPGRLEAIERAVNSNLAASKDIARSLEEVRRQKVQELADAVIMAVGHKRGIDEERAHPTTFAPNQAVDPGTMAVAAASAATAAAALAAPAAAALAAPPAAAIAAAPAAEIAAPPVVKVVVPPAVEEAVRAAFEKERLADPQPSSKGKTS